MVAMPDDLKPLCFVLMPFGSKPDPTGGKDIDFNRVYELAIKPAIVAADLEPIRADQEKTGGIIHKPMFERLLLCDFALADLTTANANVFYELGIRHAGRPSTTLTIFAEHQPIPFDINFLRSLPYSLGTDNAFDDECADSLRTAVTQRLFELREIAAQDDAPDSPLFQLVSDWDPGTIAHAKTDIFRDQVRLNNKLTDELAGYRELARKSETRTSAREKLAAFRKRIGPLDAVECGTVIDLMLTYRALEDWDGVISLQQEMPAELRQQVLVQEQLAFALNRRASGTGDLADRRAALDILQAVEDRQGASSETCGLIGRIHKDYWTEALADGDQIEAIGHLNNAIDAYVRGFMADQRDAYPGINAVTLLEIRGDEESLAMKAKLAPVVLFAVERRLDAKSADYWDHATMLELAVLDEQPDAAIRHVANALSVVRESWEPGTTENNLRMIESARRGRGEDTGWLVKIIDALKKKQRDMN